MKDIMLKFANMRKAQEFTILPYDGKGIATLSSDKSILQIDVSGATQNAVYNTKGSSFVHLNKGLGAVRVSDFPKEVIQQISDRIKGHGETINLGGGVMYAHQTLTNLV
jgi:hypothetical protein